MADIAFIGLGAMGGRMAARLLAAGHRLAVYNRTAEKAEPLVSLGARPARSPQDAVRSAEVVFTSVADPFALRAVVEGPHGIAAGIRAGATLIETSTVGPDAVRGLSRHLSHVIDAPVLGSIAGAEAGQLTLLIGGERAQVERWLPVISELGTPMYLGPSGAGAAAKLVANSALFGVLALLGETVALADGLGLSRDAIGRLLSATPLAEQAHRRGDLLHSLPARTRFSLELASKDAELVLAAAAAAAREMPLAAASAQWLRQSAEDGHGGLDYTAMLQTIIRARGEAPQAPAEPRLAPAEPWGDGCELWRLVDRPALAVAVERLPPGSADSPHLHRRARQWFYVLDGRATFHRNGGPIELGERALLEVPPGTPHSVANEAGEDLRLLVMSSPRHRGDRVELTDPRPSPDPSR